jgi:hypothetical protein
MIPKEVFLSHSSNNLPMAIRVSNTLRNHGVPVWFSPTNIMTAQQWHDEIGNALRRCDWFMVLLSNAAVNSRWVKWELHYALRHNQYDNHIMPVIIENCEYEELSWTLGVFQMVDMTNNEEDAFTQILRSWGLGFDRNRAS